MKKGFTLVELLGSIVILSILATIALPVIDKSIKNGKNTAYKAQIVQIEKSAQSWAADNLEVLPEDDGGIASITVRDLKLGGYLDKDIKNPKNDNLFPNDMIITITKDSNKYKYDVLEDTGTQTTNNLVQNSPTVILNGNYIEYVEAGTTYTDKGAVATSATGSSLTVIKDITKNGSAVSSISTTALATYKITYSATANSITTKATRTVVVRDTTKPVITIPSGITVISSSSVSSFNALTGVSATDNLDGSITSISVNSNLSKVRGIYVIVYSATDKSGNTADKRRVVKVQ